LKKNGSSPNYSNVVKWVDMMVVLRSSYCQVTPTEFIESLTIGLKTSVRRPEVFSLKYSVAELSRALQDLLCIVDLQM